MHHSPDDVPKDVRDIVNFDPVAVLERESRILLDPRFLRTLHAEMYDELGAEQARATLFQMGFLHGLQDATRALECDVPHGQFESDILRHTPLRMDLRTLPSTESAGALEVHGVWPESHEAEAHLGSLGRSDSPICQMSAGYTSGWLSASFERNIIAIEVECSATGYEGCHFIAREAEQWRQRNDSAAQELLDALPFDVFRAAVREHKAEERELDEFAYGSAAEPECQTGAFDRDASVIHVWGPVMVLPYAGPENTLRALELIGHDGQARGVSVVVVDLAGAIVDEAFGALALEQIVHTAESWGAEAIFADPSSMSERVIAELESPPLMVLKDIENAIATAFQIAQSQQNTV